MGKRQRRQSQNSRYMREILQKLKEFDLDEVRLLCTKYRTNNPGGRESRRTSRRASRRKTSS